MGYVDDWVVCAFTFDLDIYCVDGGLMFHMKFI